VLGVPVGAAIGSAVALFLWTLNLAIETFWDNSWLLFLLPVGGMAVGLLYHLVGKSVEAGNNLVMEQIHEPGGGVPARMAPLVLIGTVVTHLFGGSAGREGTAVQMGGSIASTIGRALWLSEADHQMLLTAGVASGFGAVFGTPLAGAFFGVEVLVIGLVNFQSFLPCLVASISGDYVTKWWGIQHTHYLIRSFSEMALIGELPALSVMLLLKVAVAGAIFGLAAYIFAEMAHGLQRVFRMLALSVIVRPALGAIALIGLAYVVGCDYLSLGVTANPHHPDQISILSSFQKGGATYWSWWWKTVFTTVTISSGFKGGEVTPLFYVGATLGNALARLLNAPVGLFAGLGFVGVFSGATNTPIACTMMGVELFAAGGNPDLMRSGLVVYLATACFVAYLMSGHSGIYLSQKIGTPKLVSPILPPETTLRKARELKPELGGVVLTKFTSNVRTESGPVRPASSPEAPTAATTIGDAQTEPPSTSLLNGDMDTKIISQREIGFREIGRVRIYMDLSERQQGHGFRAFFARPIYQEIIAAAQAQGIPNAAAQYVHQGYTLGGPLELGSQATSRKDLNLCVELIAERETLESFCREHEKLLEGKVIVYEHIEHWEVGRGQNVTSYGSALS
jgi:H+/Cl- antiporter ClcA